ncbi:glutathione-regulated potassium-efflux system protein KefC [Noviherbaspirillum pedocola]|uniref:Glutathione-regulated potassium-efflux system protein KefC n=1 Tax=Noviherbaspirillum pedocola TaxID=2801341 RepID=A0A934SRG8_9BURK|nr:glutathione-regulated potassium-efflux system protein KefC [Noviherbaspirillum pedocola]MBK4733923.1 glutathione-regulated potassium-efflux system protein KefC [Noviherbaspirillum pedocola]
MEQGPLQDALIFLLAAVLAVPIAKRLGLGSVLGYLLAGAAIGPWGLRLVSDVQQMLHFSEFGVVLLLFLIGLELEPKRLWALRRSIFGGGAAQVGLVSAALTGAAVAVGVPWKIALIAALGLSLSSTAIALATLSERNLAGTPAGTAGFGILLFQDIAAIPMIAVVPLLGVATDHGQEGYGGALLVVAVVAALVIGGRYLLRPALRFIAATDLREIFTAFALLLVIAIALLMNKVGLSMALGTFIAGVLLADSEYRHALETDIEPFKGLLLGLFFISVGMSVDFGVLLGQPWRILGLVLVFLAIKILVLYAMSGRLGIARAQRPLFAIVLSQGGEFAFVVFGAAATARVFSQEIASMLVVAVTLSMVATPLLLLLHDRVLAPRLAGSRQRPDDEVEAREDHVIIAGFGRFGQIIGRLLHANRIRLTVLDHDPDQIDLLRRFGWEVYYGDATRLDLLHAAGAERARALIVAIDDVEDSLALVDAAREAFPELPILARARNVSHYYDLMDRGVTIIERETFESALLLGRRVLQQLGYGAWHARQAAMKFRDHNLKSLQAVYPYYRDQKQFVSMSKQARDELEEMFARDLEASKTEREDGWD